MSETTAPGPRHARPEELEPPTGAIPTVLPGEFTDDATMVLPVIPRQRTEPPADVEGPVRPSTGSPVAPRARRRRVLPAVLAAVTACLLAGGIVVGVTGLAEPATGEPGTSTTP